jgi:glycosyltransferase involved in cell wall biosynthesis
MKPRVLHIIPALTQGGAEKLLVDLVSHSQQAMEMKVVTLLADVPFFHLDAGIVSSLGMRRGRLSLPAVVRLRRKIEEIRPDVIHAWLYHGNLFSIAAVGLGIPIIWAIHNTTLSAEHSKLLTRLANRICARISGRVPARIVYCAATARDVHERAGYDRSRGLVIENGIDVGAFAFDAAARRRTRDAIGIAEDDYAVGCVARFDPQKNHPMLIEAFSLIDMGERATLVLVGRGCTEDNDELVRCLQRFGVRDKARLLGERRDMPAIMSALDVLVSASSYGEGLPLAVIEAAAAGLPIVTTDVGDVRALVLDPAHLVSPGDANAMAAMIRNAREYGAEIDKRQAERRARIVRDFSLANSLARYQALYRLLAQSA